MRFESQLPAVVAVGQQVMKLRLFTLWISATMTLLTVSGIFSAQAQRDSATATNQLVPKVNVSDATSVDPGLNKEDKFKLLNDKIQKLDSNPGRDWADYEQTARELIKEFPDRPDGYQDLRTEIEFGNRSKGVALAKELADSSAPESFRLWAKGFLYRSGLYEKPVTLRFVALDGREVDLAQMKGRVVLINFWGTACVPCVAELPEIRATYDKYHTQGFEVIGISFDSDKAQLTRFINEKGLPWPQAFDGKQGVDNKYGQEFGVCAIPHLLLLDKTGCLRLDGFYPWARFESTITNLLAEPQIAHLDLPLN